MSEKYTIGLRNLNELLGDDSAEVRNIPVGDIDEFPGHPFKVCEDENLKKLVDSISKIGITTPVLVRQKDGRYQMISGHRRKRAAELLAIDTVPAIIRDMDDDEAVIAMVDSNNQRSSFLPSEKAKAYKMHYEALKHQGKVGGNTLEELAKYYAESGKTIQRYIQIAGLIPEMLELLDTKKMGFSIAVTLSGLSSTDQGTVAKMIHSSKLKISGRLATAIKMLGENGNLTEHTISTLVAGPEFKVKERKTQSIFAKYFPKGTPNEEIEKTIIHLLEQYHAQYQK